MVARAKKFFSLLAYIFKARIPTPSQAFFLVCLATLTGLATGLWVPGVALTSYVVAWLSFVGFTTTVYYRPRVAFLCAVTAAFCFGVARSSSVRELQHPLVPFIDGKTHVVSGIIEYPPDPQRRSVRFSVKTFVVDGLRQTATLQAVAEPFPAIRVGDILELRCKFTAESSGRRPEIPTCIFPEVTIVRHESVGWRSFLYRATDAVAERIREAFPEPAAGFIHGLLLGGSASLPETWREALLATGTVHLVALSGFNITIIASFLLVILRFAAVPRRYQALVIGLGLSVFVLAVGAQASLVRAAIMGMLVVVASALGRRSAARNTVVVAAVLMALVDPFILTDDIGFQLSFLATIGILIFYPRLEVHMRLVPEFFGVREALLLTISAQLLVTPLIIWYFGRLSFIAPFVNAVVVPAIPFIMFFGVLGAAGAFIAPAVGQVLGLPAWMAAQVVLKIIHGAARIPYASVLLPVPSFFFAACMFAIVGSVIIYLFRWPPKGVAKNPWV